MGRFNRFLHLERDRGATGGDPPKSEVPASSREERFGALETAQAAPDAVGTAGGHLARFDEAAAKGAMQLDEKRAEDQPFVRCAKCEGDNNKFAHECVHCHNDLHCAEQRAFNEKLWAELREAREAERAAHAERRRAEAEQSAQLAKERREGFEQMARDVAAQTRQRLGDDQVSALLGGRRRGVAQPAVELLIGGAIGLFVLLVVAVLGGWPMLLRVAPVVLLVLAAMALRAFLMR